MPSCVQCGKQCSTEISFNWTNGVLYLCSEECRKESASWRLARYKKDGEPKR